MTKDDRLTPLQAALQILRHRIERSGFGWGQDPDQLRLLGESDLLVASFCQAMHETLWTAANAGVDEETLTANLMGGLTSCLTWFALAEHWGEDGSTARHCDVYWAHQPRHVERWRGADFGIARRLPASERLHISLYQAKVVDRGNTVNLLRSLRKEYRARADRNLVYLLEAEPTEELPAWKLHQIHRLHRTRALGLAHAGHDAMASDAPEWVRYVFWTTSRSCGGSLPPPRTKSVPALLREMRRHRRNRRDPRMHKGDFTIDLQNEVAAASPFQDFLASACCDDGNDLHVHPEVARELMGDLARIGIPSFLAVDEVGGDGSAEFWRDVFCLTNLEVTFKAGTSGAPRRPDRSSSPAPGMSRDP